MVMHDKGAAFWSWKGVSRFTALLTELGIDQIEAQHKEWNGKVEVFNANLHKELGEMVRDDLHGLPVGAAEVHGLSRSAAEAPAAAASGRSSANGSAAPSRRASAARAAPTRTFAAAISPSPSKPNISAWRTKAKNAGRAATADSATTRRPTQAS